MELIIIAILIIASFVVIPSGFLLFVFWAGAVTAYFFWTKRKEPWWGLIIFVAAFFIGVQPWNNPMLGSWLAFMRPAGVVPMMSGGGFVTSSSPSAAASSMEVDETIEIVIEGNGPLASFSIVPPSITVARGEVYEVGYKEGEMFMEIKNLLKTTAFNNLMPAVTTYFPGLAANLSADNPAGYVNPLDIIQVVVPGEGPRKLTAGENEFVAKRNGSLSFSLFSPRELLGAQYATATKRANGKPQPGKVILTVVRKNDLPPEQIPAPVVIPSEWQKMLENGVQVVLDSWGTVIVTLNRQESNEVIQKIVRFPELGDIAKSATPIATDLESIRAGITSWTASPVYNATEIVQIAVANMVEGDDRLLKALLKEASLTLPSTTTLTPDNLIAALVKAGGAYVDVTPTPNQIQVAKEKAKGFWQAWTGPLPAITPTFTPVSSETPTPQPMHTPLPTAAPR